jgi:hypothetical protein
MGVRISKYLRGKNIEYEYNNTQNAEWLVHRSQVLRIKDNITTDVKETETKNKYDNYKTITKIKYPNNIEVVFNYTTAGRCDLPNGLRLHKITVQERYVPGISTKFKLSYHLNQSYFLSPPSTTSVNAWPTNNTELPLSTTCNSYTPTRLRLKLNSIDLYGKDDVSSVRLFEFGYTDKAIAERIYGSRDMFGLTSAAVPMSHSTGGQNYNITTSPINVLSNKPILWVLATWFL